MVDKANAQNINIILQSSSFMLELDEVADPFNDDALMLIYLWIA